MTEPKIEIREDGYVNVTELCKAGGKRFHDWYRGEKTKLFLKKLSNVLDIEEDKLLIIKKGGKSNKQGTWGHPRVATNVAQWISVDFDIFVSGCIEEWKEVKKDNEKKYYEELNKIEGDLCNTPEKEVRDRLCEELSGRVEVETPDGFIDILTNREIIEVKCMKYWKHAIGQILVYGKYYPRHQKRIHLFDTDESAKELISKIQDFDIKVSFE